MRAPLLGCWTSRGLTRWGPDYNDVARRKYKKDIDKLKPDLAAYKRLQAQERGQEAADALATTSSAVGAPSELYRDLDTFAYADHKASDDAIDRVIGKLNSECDPFFPESGRC